MPSVTIDFHGSTVIKHPKSSLCVHVERDPVDLPMHICNGHFDTGRYLLVPLDGSRKARRLYRSVARALGRPGR